MSQRFLHVNWVGVSGAAKNKRRLQLRPDANNIYICPVTNCLHVGFKSNRGLRKHINSKHSWYYYFDEEPLIKREEIALQQPTKQKACTLHKPSFSITEGIGLNFTNWLCTSCGGGKSMKQAKQSAQRAMKFLMACFEDADCEAVLKEDFIDCCLGSPAIIIDFVKLLETEWKLSSSASLNYLNSISELVDFRKANGVSDSSLRCFAVTEVYIRRGKENLGKKKRLEYTRNLDLEQLISRNSWATLDEMELVIPYHLEHFKNIISESQKGKKPNVTDLSFATRFMATYLFIRVKCTRPMTYQFLTVEMINKAKLNGGFVDQKDFKTSDTYVFDTLALDDEIIEFLDVYIRFIRTHLNPSCEYVLLTNTGKQYTSFTSAMSILVHEAIGKYIHPTRYRQIVEIESALRLTHEEQQIISRDQKHSSQVAKLAYQKRLSRDVATKGRECMLKLVGDSRKQADETMLNVLSEINEAAESFDENVLTQAQNILTTSSSSQNDDLTITGFVNSTSSNIKKSIPVAAISDNVQFKKEVAQDHVDNSTRSKVKFSKEEDRHLALGIKKHGRGSWSKILNDSSFHFNECRNRDSLRMRSETVAYKRNIVDLTIQ